jgi:hypothetical protein
VVDHSDVARLSLPSVAEVLSLAGQYSDHQKVISPFPRRLAAVSDPSARAAFPSREEGRPSPGECGTVAQKSYRANPSTTPPREARFRKTSVVDKG